MSIAGVDRFRVVGEGSDSGVEETQEGGVDGNLTSSDAGWCPEDAAICDDFERAEPLAAPWNPTVNGDGTIAIVHVSDAKASGRALRSKYTGGSSRANAGLVFQVDRKPALVRVRSMVRIEQQPTAAGVHINSIIFPASGTFVYVRNNFAALGEYNCQSSCGYDQVEIPKLTENTWHDVTLEMDFRSTPVHRRVRVDGKLVVDAPSKRGIEAASPTKLFAGAEFADENHGASEVLVDRYVGELE